MYFQQHEMLSNLCLSGRTIEHPLAPVNSFSHGLWAEEWYTISVRTRQMVDRQAYLKLDHKES
jgi:hypothetical protein